MNGKDLDSPVIPIGCSPELERVIRQFHRDNPTAHLDGDEIDWQDSGLSPWTRETDFGHGARR